MCIRDRTIAGRVLDVYGYEGGAKTVLEAGGILGGETSGPKARLKLMSVSYTHLGDED